MASRCLHFNALNVNVREKVFCVKYRNLTGRKDITGRSEFFLTQDEKN